MTYLRMLVSRLMVLVFACLLAVFMALGATPVAAFGGNSRQEIVLPGTGDLFNCVLVAENFSSRAGPFDLVGAGSTVSIFKGLDRIDKIGYQGNEAADSSLSKVSIERDCGITQFTAIVNIDTSQTIGSASFMSAEIVYLGQDGVRYRASGSLSGVTGTIAATSLERNYVLQPEIAMQIAPGDRDGNLAYSAIQSGDTYDVGEALFGVSGGINLRAKNFGYATLNLSDVVVTDVVGVAIAEVRLDKSTSPAPPLTSTDRNIKVRYIANSVGPFSFRVSVRTNDADEDPWTMTVRGLALDVTPPRLSLVTRVPETVSGTEPLEYTFNANEAGTIDAPFGCSSATTAVSGNNTVRISRGILAGTEVVVSGCSLTVTDASGNVSKPLTIPAFTIDDKRPTVTIAPVAEPALGPITASIVFSESVTGFAASDLVVTGGRVTGLLGAGERYLAVVVPNMDGLVTITVPAAAAVDRVGNLNEASATVSTLFDDTAPGVTLSSVAAAVSGPFEMRVDFTEVVSGFADDDLTIVNGSMVRRTFTNIVIGGPLSGGTDAVKFLIQPDGTGPVSLSVAADRVTDAASRTNTASNVLVMPLDTIPPTATISQFTQGANGTLVATITLSEETPSMNRNRLTLGNATASLTGSGTSYTAVLSPIADGEVRLSLAVGAFSDLAGNLNVAASNEVISVVDLTDPIVTIDDFTGPANGDQTAVLTLSEPSPDFGVAALRVANGTAVMTGSGTRFTVVVTPTTDGQVQLFVPQAAFTDLNGNSNDSSNIVSRFVDLTAPVVSIAALTGPVGDVYSAVITLSEPVSDFTAADLALTNASATLTGSDRTYTATLTPLSDGSLGLSVPANGVSDGAGNPNSTPSNAVSASFMRARPAVNIAPFTGAANGPQTAIITLSEPVTSFVATNLSVTNGTVGLSGSGTRFTATVTPAADGAVALWVPDGVLIDATGQINTASNTVFAAVDITAPTVAIAGLSGPTNGVYQAVITLSDPSTDFGLADLVLGNATATLTGAGTNYTATLTPVADGTVTVSVAADAFTDAAGNANTASNTVEAVFAKPVVVASFTASETVFSSVPAALILTNTSTFDPLGPVPTYRWTATDGSSRTQKDPAWVFNAVGDFTLALEVCVLSVCDTSSQLISVSDGDPIAVTLAGLSGVVARTTQVTATFADTIDPSKAKALALNDFAVSGATLANLSVGTGTSTGPQVYTFDVIPNGDTAISLSLPQNVVRNSLNARNAVSNTLNAAFDGVAPTVTIADFAPPVSGVYTVAITLSKDSTDFAGDDLTFTNATATLAGSGRNYSATLTPLADGVITLSVTAGAFTDLIGNVSMASNVVSTVVDTSAPNVTIADLTSVADGTYTALITLSEDSNDFTIDDLTLFNATAELSGSGTDYTATLTPVDDGEITLSIAAEVFSDAAGNLNIVSNTVSATVDTVAPTATIGPLSAVGDGTYRATITLSDDSKDFAVDDLTVTNATATLVGSGAAYTATLSPLADGEVSLTIAADVFTDAAGNKNAASQTVTTIIDTAAPDRPTLTHIMRNDDGSITVSGTAEAGTTIAVTFPDGITTSRGLDANGTFAVTSDPVQPDGMVTVTATDAAGNVSGVASAAYVGDVTAPTVTLSDAPATFTFGETFTITVTFSEFVTGFTTSDVTVSHARVTALTGNGTTYAATISPAGTGDITIFVAADVAEDAAGNGNTASNSQQVISTVVGQTQEQIAGFMLNRANQLVASQPDLIGHLRGTHNGQFDAHVTREAGSLTVASPADTPVWLHLTSSWSQAGSSETRYTFGAAGAHSAINSNVLLGFMVAFDDAREVEGATFTSGTGWLAGPYLVGKSQTHPLYYQGRILVGKTDNTVNPFGTYQDDFTTDRMLASFKLAGEMTYETLNLIPSVQATYTADRQTTYVDSLGNTIPTQSIALGEVNASLDFTRPLDLGAGQSLLIGGVSGLWSWTDGTGQANTVTPDYEGGRARVNLGISHTAASGIRLAAAVFYDGIGARNYAATGIDLNFTYDF